MHILEQSDIVRSSGTVEASPMELGIQGDILNLVLVQLEGPLPNGKHLSSYGDRTTYVWRSAEEKRNRRAKANAVLRAINDNHPRTNIIVFPEYSLPIDDSGLRMIQEYVDDTKRVIISAADNVATTDARIVNACPIIRPLQPVHWVFKQNLSVWEESYLDRSPRQAPPRFVWRGTYSQYSLFVFVCLDFLRWPTHPDVASCSDPAILVVPMCSPDINTFHVFADVSLFGEEGRATALCNAVGDKLAGTTSLFAVVPGTARGRPVLELARIGEGFAAISIDCAALSPPLRTPLTPVTPIKSIRAYDIRGPRDAITITAAAAAVPETKPQRAILNPALFSYLNKRIRIYFANLQEYGALRRDELLSYGFECFSVLGPYDCLVTHLTTTENEFLYDIAKSMHLLAPNGKRVDALTVALLHWAAKLPIFEVRTFYKVLGSPVAANDLTAFDRNPPLASEVGGLLALGNNWNASSVHEAQRQQYEDRRWILGKTIERPGNIRLMMTIAVRSVHHGVDAVEVFEDSILGSLLDDCRVTSIFGGTGSHLEAQFVLRIRCEVHELTELIDIIHRMALKVRLFVVTRTYVIIKRWTDLAISERLTESTLSTSEDDFLRKQILPRITEGRAAKLVGQPADVQKKVIESVRRAMEPLRRYLEGSTELEESGRIEQEMVTAIASQDVRALKIPHDRLITEVDEILSRIAKQCPPDALRQFEEEGRFRKGANKSGRLSYLERILAAEYCADHGLVSDDLKQHLSGLRTRTVTVRNAFAHSEFDRISVSDVLDSICEAGVFIAKARELRL